MSGRLAAAVLCAALPCLPIQAQDHPVKPAPHAQDGKADKFVVVQVGADFQVVAKSELDNLKKQLAARHKQELAGYEKEKQAADAAHKKLDHAAPKETAVTVKPGEYASKDAAEAALQKLKGGDKTRPPAKPPAKPKRH